MQGKVYLVGAGPGDFGLITLKGYELIGQADVIVYDRLADDKLLKKARQDAEMIYVGKASSRHTMRQEEINQLLVDKAKTGAMVVRLKGGDPFVFGRGGEEALELLKADIPFEVVPGITSAISVPAYAGIPVTHRGIATSFAVITGHEDPTKSESTIKWSSLAKGVDTLVFLMGVENLPNITENLIKHGRPAETPAAVIRWGTKPEQRVLETTLGTAAQDVKEAGLKPPAIFIVGEVTKLRQDLAWFDKKPLFGKTVLVTRAREQASKLANELESLGAKVLEAPAIKIIPPETYEPLDQAIAALDSYDWLIFTSVNGVEHFFDRLFAAHKDSRALHGIKLAAIGAQTAQSLQKYGLLCDLVPMEFRAEAVVKMILPELKPGMKILLPRAKEAREVLPDQLRQAGMTVDVVQAYETIQGDADGQALAEQLAAGAIDYITFGSSSTVTNLLELLDGKKELLNQSKIVCIGPITGNTCHELGIKPDMMAEEYTISGMVKALLKDSEGSHS